MAENTDEFNGWANRETWALWMHANNTESLYVMLVDFVNAYRAADLDAMTDPRLGEEVTDWLNANLDNYLSPADAKMMRDEVGSWWRIDYAEIGAAAREMFEEGA